MLGKPRYNPNSKEYKLTAIGFDIAGQSFQTCCHLKKMK